MSLVLLAASISPASAQQVAPDGEPSAPGRSAAPVFRSGVDVVALSVTVTDTRQKHVGGLGRADFQVYENGVLQELVFFATEPVPLDLAILLDTSSSMFSTIALVQEAASGFARTLGPGDRGAIIEFSDAVQVRQPLTGDVAGLDRAIRETSAKGGTALYTAIYVALKELARENPKTEEVRRQAIVVLSDGVDTRSLLASEDVLELARQTGITIYTISLPSGPVAPQGQKGPRFFSATDYVMRSLAQESGGRAFFPLGIKELTPVYGLIADELANQYALGYVPKNPANDGAFRRLAVRLPLRPDARPRARLGYLAPRISLLR